MNDDVTLQLEMETAQMNSKKMKVPVLLPVLAFCEGSVFLTGSTGSSAVNMEKFFWRA